MYWRVFQQSVTVKNPSNNGSDIMDEDEKGQGGGGAPGW